MSETILKVEDLKTSFMTSSGEVQAVRGVSFEVHKGEILGIRQRQKRYFHVHPAPAGRYCPH